MAPTVQNNTAPEKRSSQTVEKRSEMIPDMPFDLKRISYPCDTTRHVRYTLTSFERSYKYEITPDVYFKLQSFKVIEDIVASKDSKSDEIDKSDKEDNTKGKESSQSSHSEEERKIKCVSSDARSDSDNSDDEMKSKKISERMARKVNSDSSITDDSEQESSGSDSDE